MLNAVKFWILLSALLSAAGWILSALNELNGAGYSVVFALFAAAMIFWQSKTKWRPQKSPSQLLQKFKRRFKRPTPLLFMALVLLTLAGGALYPPVNGSSTAYRIPRILDWLAAGHWHWIHTLDSRLNIAGCGFEWHFPPLILLTHSDRLLFLFDWFSFLLLPGLIFGVFIRLQVRPRVAWWWSWILPSGWCFIMQAGSTLDDAFAAPFALAAIEFALRARANHSVKDLWFSMLAAALAAGVKQTDILLAIPGLIALLPGARWLLKRPLGTAAVISVCLIVSALPMIIANMRYVGTWSGVSAHSQAVGELHSPLWGIVGNVFILTIQNLKPPVFPFVHQWQAAMGHFLQTPLGAHFTQFQYFGAMSFGVGESAAALGMGVSLLILVSLAAAWHYRRALGAAGMADQADTLLRVLRWSPWALVLVFMAKVGTYENGRLLASYYILFFPLLLVMPGQSVLVRRRWWQAAALLVMVLAALLVVVSRERPLFPAQTILARLEAAHPHSKFIANVARTYAQTPAFIGERESASSHLPPDEKAIGYAAFTDGQASESLWLPFGQRQVRYVLPEDTAQDLRAEGIHDVVVEDAYLTMNNDTIQQWLAQYNATSVSQWQFQADPYLPPENFYLVRLQNP